MNQHANSLINRHALDDAVSIQNTKFTGLAQVGNTLRSITLRESCKATIEICFGKFGIAQDSLVIVGNSRTKVTLGTSQVTKIGRAHV